MSGLPSEAPRKPCQASWAPRPPKGAPRSQPRGKTRLPWVLQALGLGPGTSLGPAHTAPPPILGPCLPSLPPAPVEAPHSQGGRAIPSSRFSPRHPDPGLSPHKAGPSEKAPPQGGLRRLLRVSDTFTRPESSEPRWRKHWTRRPHPRHPHPGPPEKDAGSRVQRRPVSNLGPLTSNSRRANPGLPVTAGSHDQQGCEQGRNSCFLPALPEDKPSGSLSLTQEVARHQRRTPRPWSRPPAASGSKPSPGALQGPGEKAETPAKGLGAPTTSTPSGNQPRRAAALSRHPAVQIVAAPPPRLRPHPHPQPRGPSGFRTFYLPFRGVTKSPSCV